jgi:hypothetical protein
MAGDREKAAGEAAAEKVLRREGVIGDESAVAEAAETEADAAAAQSGGDAGNPAQDAPSGPPAAVDVSGGVPYADARHHAGTWGLKVAAGIAVAAAVLAYLRARR